MVPVLLRANANTLKCLHQDIVPLPADPSRIGVDKSLPLAPCLCICQGVTLASGTASGIGQSLPRTGERRVLAVEVRM